MTTPMTLERYCDLKDELIRLGYASEIDWCENMDEAKQLENFVFEYIFVICNSGMKAQIATVIYKKILKAIADRVNISDVFGHVGKVAAIEHVIANETDIINGFKDATDKLEYLETLPYIGKITKYHLAKNLGIDVAKPDRHLSRIADDNNTTPEQLCSGISDRTGDRVATVDGVIWRAANLGLI